ncbi:BTB/POZ domain-containing protein At3g05675-like [Impatiens glandulifera]|uniref:BTB/POZ domain-containing protein At3g05675-like n=1 Tax=Impatiens glandulifera TaxID=253017 RepID=UPI001FB0BD78|nr:BTB/POZ domain-containing protein At3g05675-like [Impatiens glandulifera]
MTITAGSANGASIPKKRQRIGSTSTRHSSSHDPSREDAVPIEPFLKPKTFCRSTSHSSGGFGGFNDSSTADVFLQLHLDESVVLYSDESEPVPVPAPFDSTEQVEDIQVYLHSDVIIHRSKYFAALLSDLWQTEPEAGETDRKMYRFGLVVPNATGSIEDHLTVLELLYTNDFTSVIDSVSVALSILPVALKLLFEDCVKSCVRFLEAVSWSDEEEKRVLSFLPLLREEESRELLGRVLPLRNDSCEEMLHGLIVTAINNHPNMASAKAFVAMLLRESSKEATSKVLNRAFETSFKMVKESLDEYSSPDFRGYHNDTEAIQRLNLHSAMTNGKHLLWLVERMIELRVAENAVKRWISQPLFTIDLLRAFRDDAWKNIVPGLPSVMLRCTSRLAIAVASGSVLVDKKGRMQLVKDWLPVLALCKDSSSPFFSSNKSLYVEVEETFLRIISTLPMSDAQELLQRCLSFSTRNVEDCPHLITAFTTWFRRASHPPQAEAENPSSSSA